VGEPEVPQKTPLQVQVLPYTDESTHDTCCKQAKAVSSKNTQAFIGILINFYSLIFLN
jgi:hypothetical protein